jgi:putative lipoprotein
MTEAACLTLGSLHDRIAKDWAYVRSYVLKDGHLFMSLMADGGIYEFEPMSERQAATASQSAHVKGTVSYVQRIALTESAVVEIKLFDISRADTPAATIAEQIIRPAGRQVPIDFDVSYDPSRIDPRGRYAIQARIFEGNIVRFVSADAYLVITGGNPTSIKVIVRPIGN